MQKKLQLHHESRNVSGCPFEITPTKIKVQAMKEVPKGYYGYTSCHHLYMS